MSCKDFEKSAKVIETKWLVGAFFDDFSALCSIVRAARRERNSGTLMGEAGRAATFVWIRKGDSDCWRLTRYNSAFIGHMSMITCGLFESGLWKFIRTVGNAGRGLTPWSLWLMRSCDAARTWNCPRNSRCGEVCGDNMRVLGTCTLRRITRRCANDREDKIGMGRNFVRAASAGRRHERVGADGWGECGDAAS